MIGLWGVMCWKTLPRLKAKPLLRLCFNSCLFYNFFVLIQKWFTSSTTLIKLQVSLRWLYEQGVSMVAKSFNKDRMKENLEIFDWSLTNEELNKIDQLPQRKRVLLAPLLGPHDLVLEIDAEIWSSACSDNSVLITLHS